MSFTIEDCELNSIMVRAAPFVALATYCTAAEARHAWAGARFAGRREGDSERNDMPPPAGPPRWLSSLLSPPTERQQPSQLEQLEQAKQLGQQQQQQQRPRGAGAAALAQRLVSSAAPSVRFLAQTVQQAASPKDEAEQKVIGDVIEPLPMPASGAETAPTPTPRRRQRTRGLAPSNEADFEALPPSSGKKSPARKKRILMLISDTGGGHRASAQAMESMLEQIAPGTCEVSIVDIFTEYTPWPFCKFVPGYTEMAKNPWMWKYSWHLSAVIPCMHFCSFVGNLRCGRSMKRCLDDYDPDLVLSLHPLTQALPIEALERGWAPKGKKGQKGKRTLPFATIVTDLGSAHPWWFHRGVDLCFVPSDRLHKKALRRGLTEDQIREYGLPVRPSFWQTPRKKEVLVNELGLDEGRKTVLVVGGGDGVGSLGKIVEATANELGRECPGGAQVVAVCGKNKQLRSDLEAMRWDNVNVQVCGFVKQMSDYMEVADVIITKAGPGTIAEASIRGLPTMLSTFLPGQEAGNVPYVVENGFGEYSKDPKVIARTVSGWIQDPKKLESMSKAAHAASAPQATQEIAMDVLTLLEEHEAAGQ